MMTEEQRRNILKEKIKAYEESHRPTSLKEEEVVKIEEQPTEEQSKIGLIELLNSLIQDQWDIVSKYNSAIATFEYEGFTDYIPSLKNLVEDETANIGILEGLMIQLNPDIELPLEQGKETVSKDFV